MKYTLLFLALCLIIAAGCTGTEPEAATPESAGTLDEAREVFGPDIPEPSYLPEGYTFENAVRYPDGSVTLIYNGTAGDLRVTRLSSADAPCPDPTVSGNKEWTSQGNGIVGRLVYENDDRSEGSLWRLRWDWNNASFCMTGSLPAEEIMKIAASVVVGR
ncbi:MULTISPECIES: DUF4367 domain-containing protein [unclassified Methanoculleus]|jgi:hypothetical protein|uniref:DUF4367 domain-containing protein n=1 Tax=Methanoculleus palmolei TaxID=72612 RepID=A0ABD8AAN8_9EURY|nr:DUF4367 domain-containing protein [Methanoculleus sp. UBA377]MDD2472902.1 DUF4367 domain-containing protein [Methanoculleus sp.]WOX56596.1 DUF4367 domain-containing protein [Methanoculleus palmolei]